MANRRNRHGQHIRKFNKGGGMHCRVGQQSVLFALEYLLLICNFSKSIYIVIAKEYSEYNTQE